MYEIPHDKSKKEFYKEILTPEEYEKWENKSNPARSQETNRADNYRGYNGEKWSEEDDSYGVNTINVLELLWGQPWNNLALNYVYALRPSGIRVVQNGTCLDSQDWRVTVWLEDDDITIKKIEQEVRIGLYGATCGHDLNIQLREQKEKYKNNE